MLGCMPSDAHRIETHPAGSHVRVTLGDQLLADSHGAVALDEKGLPLRFYLPREDASAELLDSDTHSFCPFKGRASYHSVKLSDGEVVEDVAWYYPHPLPAAGEVADMLSFAGERVQVQLDGQPAA